MLRLDWLVLLEKPPPHMGTTAVMGLSCPPGSCHRGSPEASRSLELLLAGRGNMVVFS